MTEPAVEEQDGRAALAAIGIHWIAVPTPFAVGPVNCFLIEDDPLTLVDAGPNSGTALDTLARALNQLGHGVADLELIVVTHQHMDHLGLVEILVGRSGAEVAAWHELGPYMADFDQSAAADDAYAQQVMRRHGIPEDLVRALGTVGMAFRGYGSSSSLERPLRDGDAVTLRDRTLTALHRPGHSPSDTVFWDAERRILLAGDHLLSHISSNAIVARPLSGPADQPRPQPLVAYIDSLRKTREIDAQLVLGGHGKLIHDHVKLIDERLRLHDRRARKFARMLEGGPRSAYQIAVGTWGNVAVTQAYLTISEVLGHLDLLIAAGSVREIDDGAVTRYELVS
jgi:glyoxylase-like metal-dependent hydrolase (beta-lactamase superfamily II)